MADDATKNTCQFEGRKRPAGKSVCQLLRGAAVSTIDWSRVPGPSDKRIAIRVSEQAERKLRRGHPWLFESAICQQSHEGRPGDLAVVFDRKRRFLAVGLYDPRSAIRVRALQHGKQAPIDGDWFRRRLADAAALRAPLPRQGTTGYRLVHGGNDGLPGMVVDRYAATLVIKLYTAAWLPHLQQVLRALADTVQAERVVLRLGRSAQAQPEVLYGLGDGTLLHGPEVEAPVLFQENGLSFEADPRRGQKTGFFLDQRDNRARVERLASGKAVLDVFAYTGGFSVYAARGGAHTVVSVDASRPALEAAARNLALNRELAPIAASVHETIAGDAFEVLARLGRSGRRFDVVVVDPPAFARKRAAVGGALAAYERLTQLGLQVLRPEGTLVMACCSRAVGAEDFFVAVGRAAARAGRPLREIERTGQPLDHPVTFEGGAYLKCLFAVVP